MPPKKKQKQNRSKGRPAKNRLPVGSGDDPVPKHPSTQADESQQQQEGQQEPASTAKSQWPAGRSWDEYFQVLRHFKSVYNHCQVWPCTSNDDDFVRWVHQQHLLGLFKALPKDRFNKLKRLTNFDFSTNSQQYRWFRQLEKLRRCHFSPKAKTPLSSWLSVQDAEYFGRTSNEMADYKVEALRNLQALLPNPLSRPPPLPAAAATQVPPGPPVQLGHSCVLLPPGQPLLYSARGHPTHYYPPNRHRPFNYLLPQLYPPSFHYPPHRCPPTTNYPTQYCPPPQHFGNPSHGFAPPQQRRDSRHAMEQQRPRTVTPSDHVGATGDDNGDDDDDDDLSGTTKPHWSDEIDLYAILGLEWHPDTFNFFGMVDQEQAEKASKKDWIQELPFLDKEMVDQLKVDFEEWYDNKDSDGNKDKGKLKIHTGSSFAKDGSDFVVHHFDRIDGYHKEIGERVLDLYESHKFFKALSDGHEYFDLDSGAAFARGSALDNVRNIALEALKKMIMEKGENRGGYGFCSPIHECGELKPPDISKPVGKRGRKWKAAQLSARVQEEVDKCGCELAAFSAHWQKGNEKKEGGEKKGREDAAAFFTTFFASFFDPHTDIFDDMALFLHLLGQAFTFLRCTGEPGLPLYFDIESDGFKAFLKWVMDTLEKAPDAASRAKLVADCNLFFKKLKEHPVYCGRGTSQEKQAEEWNCIKCFELGLGSLLLFNAKHHVHGSIVTTLARFIVVLHYLLSSQRKKKINEGEK